jgi:hypothetical protein
MISRTQFDQMSDDQKFDFLYRCALASFQAGERMSSALVHLEERLTAKIDATHPDSASKPQR